MIRASDRARIRSAKTGALEGPTKMEDAKVINIMRLDLQSCAYAYV